MDHPSVFEVRIQFRSPPTPLRLRYVAEELATRAKDLGATSVEVSGAGDAALVEDD